MKPTEALSGLLAVVLLALVLPLRAQEVGLAARVNGVEISNFRLERHFSDYLSTQGRSVGAIRSPSTYKRLKREALEQLIDKELLWQEAQRLAVKVEDTQVQQELEAKRSAFRSADAFTRALTEAGFDETSYADYLRHELVASQVLQVLSQPAPINEQEVRRVYEENQARLVRPEQVRARHLLLAVPAGADAAVAREAEQRIRDLLQQIRTGADFAELAQRHSEDANAQQGGDLGYFSRGKMVPAFEAAAFALRPGEVSEPVRSPYGWHLIQLEAHRPSEPLEQAQGLSIVRQMLLGQRQAQARTAALERLRAGSKIEVLTAL
ncbi:peptidylprolyl isomerase [Pseudomonas sp.]|uniref:foldase protein PrsA n=1 Tax=Pseudomonas sp. TaxID=306 RepID=UPI00299E50C5|nr:peptidylprolyl isomerase [Pseudomonas sp.]MDX1368506.1 peptidylprolyl isomerase [Pseudomonas sp.]